MIEIFLTCILGIIGGIFGGGLALGPTSIMLPGLTILKLVKNQKTAIGTALLSSPVSWGGAYKYYKEGYVNIKLGLIYLFFYIIFSFIGASIFELFDEKYLQYLISIFYFLFGFYFLYIAIYK